MSIAGSGSSFEEILLKILNSNLGAARPCFQRKSCFCFTETKSLILGAFVVKKWSKPKLSTVTHDIGPHKSLCYKRHELPTHELAQKDQWSLFDLSLRMRMLRF